MEKINKRAVGFEVQLKVREASEGGESRIIEGYALKFGVRSRLLLDWWVGVYYEILEKGCLTRETLDACDIMLTMFHDRQLILGRSKNGVGTLHYEIDEIGVKFWCEMPKTVDGDKALELIARGDITGCSFIYSTDEKDSENAVSYEKTGEKTEDGEEILLRHVKRIDNVYDFTITPKPAFEQTNVTKRELEDAGIVFDEKPKTVEEPKQIDLAKKREAIREIKKRISHTV
jgi:HK97 family phage prohead protease